MELLWTRRALRRLDEIGAYISFDNPVTAGEVIHRIVSAAERLKQFPQSGRPGRVRNSRELVLADIPYIVIYRIDRDQVQVLTVIHAAQQRPMKR
jgi:addiction module RelE/StbE family toxin